MGCPLSIDLRSRLLAAIDKVISSRAAARFDVAASTAIRWHARRRDMSAFAAKPQRRRCAFAPARGASGGSPLYLGGAEGHSARRTSGQAWTSTNMTRSHSRCGKASDCGWFPHEHRKTTTLVAALRMTGIVAPMVLDGPINGDWFEVYVEQVLVPELKPGDVIIMDKLSSHKRPAVWLSGPCGRAARGVRRYADREFETRLEVPTRHKAPRRSAP